MENFYLVIVYLDYAIFKDIFIKGNSEKAQINGWLDWLGTSNLKLVYRPSYKRVNFVACTKQL